MKTKRVGQAGLTAFILLFISHGARADSIDVSLTQTSQTALAGSTVTFDATLTNLSSTDRIFLNGDSSSTSSLFLTVDDLPFLVNFPFFLNPGESSGPFELFNVAIDAAAATGTYDFNTFSILGGFDGGSFDTLGTTSFSLTVAEPTAAVPEPATAYLLLTGLLAVLLLIRLRRA
jgi:hypothetical protein